MSYLALIFFIFINEKISRMYKICVKKDNNSINTIYINKEDI